jgi:hypothetical protein
MRFVANSGKPSRLALDFAPRASSRKHHAAHGAGYADGMDVSTYTAVVGVGP